MSKKEIIGKDDPNAGDPESKMDQLLAGIRAMLEDNEQGYDSVIIDENGITYQKSNTREVNLNKPKNNAKLS